MGLKRSQVVLFHHYTIYLRVQAPMMQKPYCVCTDFLLRVSPIILESSSTKHISLQQCDPWLEVENCRVPTGH